MYSGIWPVIRTVTMLLLITYKDNYLFFKGNYVNETYILQKRSCGSQQICVILSGIAVVTNHLKRTGDM